jgi:alkylation response protein AidB-like acyl-CoA dehydrogenase
MTSDLLYSEIEEHLRDSVRRLVLRDAKPPTVAAAYDHKVDFSDLRSSLFVDIGVAGLLVPEELGGAGATMREAAVVAEELGRAVAPVPFLTSAVIATVVLTHTGERELLSLLAQGTITAATIVSFVDARLPETPSVRATADGLVGTVRSVAGADTADLLIVPAAGKAGVELHFVDREADVGITVEPIPSLDMTRQVSDVTFTKASSRLIGSDSARSAVNLSLQAGAGVLASEQLGVATWCLDTALAHVKERHQFGRPIGSFQALKHRLAELWVEVGQAAAAARYAADVLARAEDDAPIAVAVAQSYCSSVAVHAADECIQLQGGTGMTWESPTHLYLKRAKADELALGNPFQHRARLGELLELPPDH